jgi:hypothetical protein
MKLIENSQKNLVEAVARASASGAKQYPISPF